MHGFPSWELARHAARYAFKQNASVHPAGPRTGTPTYQSADWNSDSVIPIEPADRLRLGWCLPNALRHNCSWCLCCWLSSKCDDDAQGRQTTPALAPRTQHEPRMRAPTHPRASRQHGSRRHLEKRTLSQTHAHTGTQGVVFRPPALSHVLHIRGPSRSLAAPLLCDHTRLTTSTTMEHNLGWAALGPCGATD